MLCGCVRFSWKPKSISGDLETPPMLGKLLVSDCRRFYHSGAPSPPASRSFESLIIPERETVMEPPFRKSNSLNKVD
jgi:hypothetical protein